MKGYFLNARKFISKSGKTCYVVSVANCDGEVSEFFVSQDFYNNVSTSFAPFDYVEISFNVSRGFVLLSGINHIDINEKN